MLIQNDFLNISIPIIVFHSDKTITETEQKKGDCVLNIEDIKKLIASSGGSISSGKGSHQKIEFEGDFSKFSFEQDKITYSLSGSDNATLKNYQIIQLRNLFDRLGFGQLFLDSLSQ